MVISVGEGVEQSLSITLNVQELGGPKIWVKASNEEHKKILQRLHVDRAIVPEMEAAVMAAHQLCHPGMLDLIPKYGGIAIQELRVDNWHGRTLVDLNLIQSFGVMVMGIRPAGERAFQFAQGRYAGGGRQGRCRAQAGAVACLAAVDQYKRTP